MALLKAEEIENGRKMASGVAVRLGIGQPGRIIEMIARTAINRGRIAEGALVFSTSKGKERAEWMGFG